MEKHFSELENVISLCSFLCFLYYDFFSLVVNKANVTVASHVYKGAALQCCSKKHAPQFANVCLTLVCTIKLIISFS